MQPIERYALVTLLFLVVLVVVVAMWDDGSAGGAAPGGPDGRDATVATRVEEPRARRTVPDRRTERRTERKLPVNTGRDDANVPPRVQTRTNGEGAHSVRPGGAGRLQSEAPPRTPPRAASAEELAGLMEPIKPRQGSEGAPNMLARDRDRGAPGRSDRGMLNSPYVDGRSARGSRDPVASGPSRDSTQGSRSASTVPPRPSSIQPRKGTSTASATKPPALPKPDRSRPAPSTGTRTYTIRSGDSLERIARRELPGARTNDAVEEIARLNALSKPYTIYAGDELKLPSSTSLPAAASAAGASATSSATRSASATEGRSTYTVRPGDVLSSVLVARYGTYKRSIALVTELNPGLDPDMLRAGATIVMPRPDEIPGGVSAPAAAAASAAAPAASRRTTSSRSSEYVVR